MTATTYAILDDCTAKRATVSRLLTEAEYDAEVERADQYRRALARKVWTSGRRMRTDRKLVATSATIEVGQRVYLAALIAAGAALTAAA